MQKHQHAAAALFARVLVVLFFLITARSAFAEHPTSITLKDHAGNAIDPASRTPYSPEATCSGCHNFTDITFGYHFQQGRTGATDEIQVADDFDALRDWILSDGMYGKW